MAVSRVAAPGRVFVVPVDERRHAVGQVLARYGRHTQFYAIFDWWVSPRESPLDGFAARSGREHVALLALSMDAKLAVKDWVVVGRAPIAAASILPAFKEATAPGVYDVVDHSGMRRRRATAADVELLPFRRVVAPIILENAARAVAGVTDWQPDYNDFNPLGRVTSADAFGL